MDHKSVVEARAKIKASIDHLAGEFRGLRSGRATPALVENIRVDYYGSQTPISQLAQIQIPEPRQIAIKPYDAGALKDIEKAIQASQLGINPQNDGKVLRLTVPMLSEEQRKKLGARLKEMSEVTKVALRNSRRDANKQIDDSSELTDDQIAKAKEVVQALLKQHEGEVDKMLAAKTKEIMES
ncbi:MAG: ribosome recycling factor [Planctomycetes bacterium]|nr:ribosome recycling factor [Planctomycetota bacterium]